MDRIIKNIVFHAPRLLSDRKFVEYLYEYRTGRKPNLDNPVTFSEKMQYLKLHNQNPLFTRLADKAEAKNYATQVIGEEHIIPTIGVYDSVSQIDWNALPEQFVLKCTHDCASVAVCRSKASLDIPKVEKALRRGLRTNYYYQNREYPYKNIRPRIICEKYMHDERQQQSLTDYKFFCFAGKPDFMYVSSGLTDHSTASISFCDLSGAPLPFCRADYKPFPEGQIPLPEHFDEMKSIAEKLARAIDTAFVRIDLYEIAGTIYFSEFTFFPNSGIIPFRPAEWDRTLGDKIQL